MSKVVSLKKVKDEKERQMKYSSYMSYLTNLEGAQLETEVNFLLTNENNNLTLSEKCNLILDEIASRTPRENKHIIDNFKV